MKRQRLVTFLAGVTCAVAAFMLAWALTEFRRFPAEIRLSYLKPTGLIRRSPDFYRNDPGRSFATAATYLAAVASNCSLHSWQLEAGFPANDADDEAFLIVRHTELTDAQFNCLARKVVAPNVQITQVSK